MRKLALFVMLFAFSGTGLALALDGHEKGDKDKEKKGKKVKAPADCKTLHDAMEGIGMNAKMVGKMMKAKKLDKASEHLASILEYAGGAGDLARPDTIKTEEQVKEFKEWLAGLRTSVEAAKKAADDDDMKALGGAMKEVSKSCGTCHDKYQPPEEEGKDDDDDGDDDGDEDDDDEDEEGEDDDDDGAKGKGKGKGKK